MAERIMKTINCMRYCRDRYLDIKHYNDHCKSDKDKLEFLPRNCWKKCIHNNNKPLGNIFDFKKVDISEKSEKH